MNWEEQTWKNRGNMTKSVSCEQMVSSFVSPGHREEEQVQADCETHGYVKGVCAFMGVSTGTTLHGGLCGHNHVRLVCTDWE